MIENRIDAKELPDKGNSNSDVSARASAEPYPSDLVKTSEEHSQSENENLRCGSCCCVPISNRVLPHQYDGQCYSPTELNEASVKCLIGKTSQVRTDVAEKAQRITTPIQFLDLVNVALVGMRREIKITRTRCEISTLGMSGRR